MSKIKLSRSQWLSIGKQAGWVKSAQQEDEYLPDPDITFGGEPEEGDLFTEDHIHFYEVGSSDRGPVVTIHDPGNKMLNIPGDPNTPANDEYMWKMLDRYMQSQKFFPNVWFISDHGNAHLMTKGN